MKCTEDVYLHNPQSILQTYNTHFIFKLQLKQSDTQPAAVWLITTAICGPPG